MNNYNKLLMMINSFQSLSKLHPCTLNNDKKTTDRYKNERKKEEKISDE